MLLSDFMRRACAALEPVYPPQEARSIVSLLCQERLGVKSYTHIIEPGYSVDAQAQAGLKDDLRRLAASEPLQHVLGHAWFCGRKFRVSPDVLIPRPETEQLVEMALSFLRASSCGDSRVLDLCTGSGCIAWSIALDEPRARVTATDISEAALRIARSQFAAQDSSCSGGKPLAPEFLTADIFNLEAELPGAPFDLICSNPPYIKESERAAMHSNVLGHDPDLALFVPDSDPLLFYRAVAAWAGKVLKPGGLGIVEINELLARETADSFMACNLANIEVIEDFRGKPRFIRFNKSE